MVFYPSVNGVSNFIASQELNIERFSSVLKGEQFKRGQLQQQRTELDRQTQRKQQKLKIIRSCIIIIIIIIMYSRLLINDTDKVIIRSDIKIQTYT